jgi:hypothetical protein
LVHSTGPLDTSYATASLLQELGVDKTKALAAGQLSYDAARGKERSEAYAKGMTNDHDAAVMQAALDITTRLNVRSAYVKHYLSLRS